MMLMYRVAKPRPSAVPVPGLVRTPEKKRGRGAPGTPTATELVTSGDSVVALDRGEDAVLRVEELLHHRVPPTEVGDREQRLRRGEVAARALHDRPVAVLDEDLLR